ncbi:hypothetical protein TanjilG_07565 [Lupinus angustifolius]|uniref:CCHC-type domain-containing protein n=1 Tax=Lupinus angustifolius TaxID=3871 RepID=A0A1J7FP42_LUPAN|nr:hypothetical protein TanjilG_07565 [Lupinus angustifolius]
MGSQDNQKANVADHKNDIELNDDAAFIPLVVLSSDGDDEEVNPDRNFVAPKADVLNGVVSITSSQQPEPVTENDCVLDEMKKTESGDQSVIIVPEEQETVKTIEATENVQLGNNIVLRKLLRGPRYFDPPDSGRGSCFNCGVEGHVALNCTEERRKKPCYEIRCYICKRFGHLCCANTDETRPREISCYKCGRLGHTGLACSRFRVEATGAATAGSCYKCGGEGHFSRECTSSMKARKRVHGLSNTKTKRSHTEDDYMGYMSAPHQMGKTRKKKPTLMDERGFTTPKKSKNRGGWISDHYAEESEFTAQKKSKNKRGWMTDHYTEEGFSTPKKRKSRGGWMTEHPADFSPSKSGKSSWKSTGTPSIRSNNIYSHGSVSHTPRSKSSNRWNSHGGTSKSHGSKAPHHRFSASRW